MSKRTFELLKKVDLNSDGIKLEEFIDLGKDACVTAELREEDKTDDWVGVDDASSSPSNQEAVVIAEPLRRFFIARGQDEELARSECER